jgi:hypothetical protein
MDGSPDLKVENPSPTANKGFSFSRSSSIGSIPGISCSSASSAHNTGILSASVTLFANFFFFFRFYQLCLLTEPFPRLWQTSFITGHGKRLFLAIRIQYEANFFFKLKTGYCTTYSVNFGYIGP